MSVYSQIEKYKHRPLELPKAVVLGKSHPHQHVCDMAAGSDVLGIGLARPHGAEVSGPWQKACEAVVDKVLFPMVSNDAEKRLEAYVAAPTGVSMYAKEQLHTSFSFSYSIFLSASLHLTYALVSP